MKKKVILALFSLFLIVALMATPVFAKDPDKGEGAQGVPFQELQDQIDDIVAELEDLEDTVQGIVDDTMATLQPQIDDLKDTVEGLIDGTIAAMQAQIASIQSQLAGLQQELDGFGQDLADEKAARIGTDNQLQADLDAEETARIAADSALQAALDAEEAARIADVNAEEVRALAAEATLQASIAGLGDGHSLDAVDGSQTDVVYVNDTGNVGIGTKSPAEKLDVQGNVKATSFFGDGSGLTGISLSETDPVFSASPASGITTDNITTWNAASGGGAGDGHSLDAADGDPVDAVYVDNEGNVGIGTTSPSGIFESRAKLGSLIEQSQELHPTGRSGSEHWQSFTAGYTGEIKYIELYVRSRVLSVPTLPDIVMPFMGKIAIFEGEGVGGTKLREKTVDFGNIGSAQWKTITFGAPIPVEPGEQYTWKFQGEIFDTPWDVVIYGSSGNPYSGGLSNAGADFDYAFKTHFAEAYTSMVFTNDGKLGIGTLDPGGDRLDVIGRAYASGGWQTTNADYAEWFEKEEDAVSGDIIGINLDTGKARKYQPGDKFIGICSSNPAYVGNRNSETDEQMAETHILVGLLGQVDFDEEQVVIEGRIVKTTDGIEIGILLSDGKVLIGR